MTLIHNPTCYNLGLDLTPIFRNTSVQDSPPEVTKTFNVTTKVEPSNLPLRFHPLSRLRRKLNSTFKVMTMMMMIIIIIIILPPKIGVHQYPGEMFGHNWSTS